MMKLQILSAILIISILLSTGCMFTRFDEQEINVKVEGVQKYNRGYLLIPAPIYGFDNDDPEMAKIAYELEEKNNWTLEVINGTTFLNITLKYDIDISLKIEDPEPSYFRSFEFNKNAERHQLDIYLHMNTPQDLQITLYSMHSDDYHWFESRCTGFLGEGWTSITVGYSLAEA